jgi:hypothetical protein
MQNYEEIFKSVLKRCGRDQTIFKYIDSIVAREVDRNDAIDNFMRREGFLPAQPQREIPRPAQPQREIPRPAQQAVQPQQTKSRILTPFGIEQIKEEHRMCSICAECAHPHEKVVQIIDCSHIYHEKCLKQYKEREGKLQCVNCGK